MPSYTCTRCQSSLSESEPRCSDCDQRMVLRMTDAEHLELATTDELIAELLGRFDHAVFAAILLPTDSTQKVLRRWVGNSITCAGLGLELSRTVLDDLAVRSE